MKLSKEQVKELAELQKRVAEVYKKMNYTGVSCREVQMSHKTFIETFETFIVKDRDCEDYQFELSTIAGSVQFLTILSAKDIADLETSHPDKFKQISYMIQEEKP